MPSGVLGAVTQIAQGIGQVDPSLGQTIAQDAAGVGQGAFAVSASASPATFLQNVTGLSSGTLLIIAALVVLALYFLLRS